MEIKIQIDMHLITMRWIITRVEFMCTLLHFFHQSVNSTRWEIKSYIQICNNVISHVYLLYHSGYYTTADDEHYYYY